ncbi:GNAT family N-acetyltransferase [Rhodobacterales bacterium LSUCC0031]|nr:GNAT family N-acetyltransferase [Rhodobacterales bacterium LSUCC0031]
MNALSYGLIAADDPALAPLIADHAAHSAAHYPGESNHHQDGAALAAIGAVMFAGRLGAAGPVVAMGGYKLIGPRAAEVKSMHVTQALQGQGAGAHILGLILDHARRAGVLHISLETGSLPASAAARRLYSRAGFVTCPPFGDYKDDPMSIFMTRTL